MTITTQTFANVFTGSAPNDGTGDDLRTSFNIVNSNFSNISLSGFNSGNINVTGDIVVSGNITANGIILTGDPDLLTGNITIGQNLSINGNITQANVAGATFLYGTLVTYGNIVLNDQVGTQSANLTLQGTMVRKIWNQSNVITTSANITLQPGGDDQVFLQITGNLAIVYNSPIVPGCIAEYTVWNNSAGNVWINLPNAKTNTARGNVFALAQGYQRLVFTAFDADAGNVFVSVG